MAQSLLFFANDALDRAAANSPPLSMGSSGDAVRCLQLGLFALGNALPRSVKQNPIRADGAFGRETFAAVRLFQQRQGLSVDGIAGRQTLGRLDQLLSAGRDPLVLALNDLKKLGGEVAQQGGSVVLARVAFERRLADANGLILGDPAKFAVQLKKYFPSPGGPRVS